MHVTLKKQISLLLALALLLTLCSGFAAAYVPGDTPTLEEFLDADCDQFIIGTDSNSFVHSAEYFPATYEISADYLNQLFRIDPTGASQLSIMTLRSKPWIGSCYGIASTMALNKLTKLGLTANPLDISFFQPGAEDYFDLATPKDNPPVVNMINYYMLAQMLAPATDNSHIVQLNNSDSLLPGGIAVNNAGDDAMADFIDKCTTEIDQGKALLFTYFTAQSGHTVLTCDYWIDEDTAGDNKPDFYLKLYDMNSRGYESDPGDQHYYYLMIENYLEKDAASPDRAMLFEYNYDRYEQADPLVSITAEDIDAANEYLNIHDPKPYKAAPDDCPTLEVQDLPGTHANYTVKPFDVNGYIEDVIDPDDPDIPKNWADVKLVDYSYDDGSHAIIPLAGEYSSPTVKNYEYSYFSENQLNMKLELTADPLDWWSTGPSRTPVGYDVALSGGNNQFSMTRTNPGGATNYASVHGVFGRARFGLDARLEGVFADNIADPGDAAPAQGYLKGPTSGNKTSGVQLYLGAMGDDTLYDMFWLYMDGFNYLEVFDGSDHPSYAGSIVLHSDGFYAPSDEGALQFKFYKGASESEIVSGGNTGADETWLKIKGDLNADGNVDISVWSAKTPDDKTSFPEFTGEPDWTTVISKPVVIGPSGGNGRDDTPVDIAPAKPSASIAGNSLKKALSLSGATVYQSGSALVIKPENGETSVTIGPEFDWEYAFKAGITEIVLDCGFARVAIPTENQKGGVAVGLKRDGDSIALTITPASVKASVTFVSSAPISPGATLYKLSGGEWLPVPGQLSVTKGNGRYFAATGPLQAGEYKLM